MTDGDLKEGEETDLARWLGHPGRPKAFAEIASAVADSGVAYWLVLVLAGAIAALGLALDSSAVIIGAMLIAPLLAPVIGLALALAVGDGRLAVEATLIIIGSTIAVIGVAALITLVLPFHTVTSEITARTRPTTLDLAIAGCSGLAGAVVSVARTRRLAAAVPGVAIAVALVPPLAVAGFGIGTGWNASVIRGSLLLYSANLAGIVVSGMLVFLAVGMNRPEIREVARRWHESAHVTGVTALIDRVPGVRSLGMLASLPGRLALMGLFVAVVALPLRVSLHQIVREARVRHAIDAAMQLFRVPDRSVIVSHTIEIGDTTTHVFLGVATTRWFSDSARSAFIRNASRAAGEPVSLVLQQVPAAAGDVGALASMLASSLPAPPAAQPVVAVTPRPDAQEGQLASAIHNLSLPDSAAVLDYSMVLRDSTPPEVDLAYAAPVSPSGAVREMVAGQLGELLQEPGVTLNVTFVSTRPRTVRRLPRDSAVVSEMTRALAQHAQLSIMVAADSGVSAKTLNAVLLPIRAIVPESRIHLEHRSAGGAISLQLMPQGAVHQAAAPGPSVPDTARRAAPAHANSGKTVVRQW